METVQNSNLSIIEKIFIKSGKIVDVRSWNGGNIYEVDVHLPNVNFGDWDKTQSIKCRISASHYTDYTPTMWRVEERICTLYIDTSHNGQGCVWAKKQVVGNDFYYLKIEAVKHFPIEGKHLVFLGDQTGIGHFCSLQQLATKDTKISGFITFNDQQSATGFSEKCSWLPLLVVLNYAAIYKQTEKWLIRHEAQKDNLVFYVVGSETLIIKLRGLLRTYGFNGSQIKLKRFWH